MLSISLFMGWVFRLVVGRPLVTIVGVLMITGFFTVQLPRLEKDDSVDKMLPEGDPLLEYSREVEAIFASDEFLIIAVESPDPFSHATVGKLVRLTDRLESIAGVREVISPTSTKNVRGSEGVLFAEPLVDEGDIPINPEALRAFRKAIQGKAIFRGSIISGDGRVFGFVLRLHQDPDKEGIVAAVQRLVDAEAGPEVIYFSGSPAINLQVGQYMGRDMGRFLPLVILVILTTFAVCFRSLRGVLLPFLALVFTVIWALGFMAMTRIPISVIGTMLPSLLIAVSSSFGIHVLHQYYEDVSVGLDKRQSLVQAMLHISPTVMLTGITTAIGFASLVLNDTRILREFGLFAAFGILAGMTIALTFLPASLVLFPTPDERKRTQVLGGMLTRFLSRIGRYNTRRSTSVLLVVALLVTGALSGYPRLFLETNAVNFFPEDDPVRQTIGRISAHFGGTIPIRTVIDAGEPNAILAPETLTQMEAYQQYLEGFDEVGNTLSIADIIKDMNKALHEGDPAYHLLPGSLEGAEQLLFLYMLASEPDEFDSLISADHSMATVIARLKQADDDNVPLGTRRTREILSRLEDYITENFSSSLQVTPTGRARDIVRTSDYIVKGLIMSMLTALVFIFFVTTLVFRSAAAGIFSILPVSVALLLNFGVMGWLGIPLDIATTLISSIAIGIGVDDSLHYLLRYRRAVRAGITDPKAAMIHTIGRAGQPLLFTSMALILGFSILTVATFKPVVYFGALAALTLFNTTLGALLVLPLVLYRVRPGFG